MTGAKVLLLDGRVLRIVEARQNAQGDITFITTLGERVPASKILTLKEAASG